MPSGEKKLRRTSPKEPSLLVTKDICGITAVSFQKLEKIIAELADFYRYEKIELSVLESQEWLRRLVEAGQEESWLKLFLPKSKERLAVRFQGVVSASRAYLQNRLSQQSETVKLWYGGPFVMVNNRLAGQPNQFWQFGFEIFGSANPIAEIELIQLGIELAKRIGIKNSYLEINSLGCADCRRVYRRALKQYYRYKLRNLCLDCRREYKKDVLQLLSCDKPGCREMREGMPEVFSYLCKDCNVHFKKVLNYLDQLSIPYLLNPYLTIFNFTYYDRTIFELRASAVRTIDEVGVRDRQDSIAFAAGGRHNYLVKQLGGVATPAAGLSVNADWLVKFVENKNQEIKNKVDVYLIQMGGLAKIKLLQVLGVLRVAGIKVGFELGSDNLNPQLKIAEQSGARFYLIIGQEEALHHEAIFREAKTGLQEVVSLEGIADLIKKRLKEKND